MNNAAIYHSTSENNTALGDSEAKQISVIQEISNSIIPAPTHLAPSNL